MKCPRCGNENQKLFRQANEAYMSAFTVDNDRAKCLVCGHQFYRSPIIAPVEIGRSQEPTRPMMKRVRMKGVEGGATGFAPVFPSYPLPPLDPKKASAEMNRKVRTSEEWEEIEKERSESKLLKDKQKVHEAVMWAALPLADVNKTMPSKAKDKISAYRTAAVEAQNKKVAEARAWAAEKNAQLKKASMVEGSLKAVPKQSVIKEPELNLFAMPTEEQSKKMQEKKSRERIEEYKKELETGD